MKYILYITLLLGPIAFAQQVGGAGQLLENRASVEQMKIQNNNWFAQYQSQNNFHTNDLGIKYRWHQDWGYTEVFLRIPEEGYFSVQVGDQVISNATGKYRFFDIKAGSTPIFIYQNGFLLYQTFIPTQHNTRTILDFFTRKGLFLLDVQPIGNQSYGIVSWNDIWNNPYGGNPLGNTLMDERSFSDFIRAFKNEDFDHNKKKIIFSQIKNTQFTAEQIRMILKEFGFDSSRLEVAKKLFHVCYDKHNFFKVYETFDFSTGKNSLMEYISEY